MLHERKDDELPWMLVIMSGQEFEVEFYETETEANSAALTALEPEVSVYVSKIIRQGSMPRIKKDKNQKSK